MDKPEITYPCRWTYRIVTTDEDSVRERVAALAGERPYELRPSKKSAQGSYTSMHLEMDVEDQVDRDAIFAGLKSDPAVKMVI